MEHTENDNKAAGAPSGLNGGLGMFERLICAVFGHRYVVERVLNRGARKVGCTRCNKHWAMHDGTRSILPWDDEFEELYAPGGMLADIDA